MSSEESSILVWCSHDLQTDVTQLRVMRVDTGEDVRLKEGTFLLRISRDESSSADRYMIRHLASGREAYIQSGPPLRAFVKACLLDDNSFTSTNSNSTGE